MRWGGGGGNLLKTLVRYFCSKLQPLSLELAIRAFALHKITCSEDLSFFSIEPPRGKTNNVVSEQVRHKPACTSTEKSKKLEISDLSRRGILLSE